MTDIISPLPGTFYQKPSPEAEPFKKTGEPVAAGDTVGLVEVMKTFIEVKAETAGTFQDYATDDGSPVTPGQVLAQVAD